MRSVSVVTRPFDPEGDLSPYTPDIDFVVYHSDVLFHHAYASNAPECLLSFCYNLFHGIFPSDGRLTDKFNNFHN